MSTITLPQNKEWNQLNKGSLLGQLQFTNRIDLDDPGILRLARRTGYVGQTTANLGVSVQAIVHGNFTSTTTNFHYWILSTDKVFTLTSDLGTFAQDALASTPSLHGGSDGCTWGGDLYVTKTSRIDKLSAGTWTATWSTSAFTNTATNFPHPIEPNVTNANLLVGDGNVLKRVDSSGVVTTAITLPTNLRIKWIRRGIGVNYLGCQARQGGYGAVVVWDGLPTTLGYNAIIPLDTPMPLTGLLDSESILNIITLDGRLMRLNGSSFQYVSELPPFRDRNCKTWGGNNTNGGGILQRGSAIIRGRIHVSIDSELEAGTYNYSPNFLSGVWVYDKDNKSWYHKYSPSNSSNDSDYGQVGGAGLLCSAISPVFTDLLLDNGSLPSASVGGDFIASARLSPNTLAGTTLRTVYSATSGENRGQFYTVKIESAEITENNVAIWCKYQGVTTASDKILFKFRTTRVDPIILGDSNTSNAATWTSTTVFTCTDPLMANVAVGNEIMIMTGHGAGATAHIDTIVNNAGTYTVTVDEAMPSIVASDTTDLIVENWTKLPGTITSSDTDGYKRIPLINVGSAKWIEIKGELRGTGEVVGIEELDLIRTDQVKAI